MVDVILLFSTMTGTMAMTNPRTTLPAAREGTTPTGDHPMSLVAEGSCVIPSHVHSTIGQLSRSPKKVQRSNPFSGSGYTLGSDERAHTSRTQADPQTPLNRRLCAISRFGVTAALKVGNCGATTIWPKRRFYPRSTPGIELPRFTPNYANRHAYMTDALLQLSSTRTSRRAPCLGRTDEDYVPTSRRGFAGSGSRLGGAVSEPATQQQLGMSGAFPALGTPPSVAPAPAPAAASRTRDPEAVAPRFSVDQSKLTTSVQVRLADGTRIVVRMNLDCARSSQFHQPLAS
ncbi:hypothetical protein V8E53_004664 [Lactarius tabidus]